MFLLFPMLLYCKTNTFCHKFVFKFALFKFDTVVSDHDRRFCLNMSSKLN